MDLWVRVKARRSLQRPRSRFGRGGGLLGGLFRGRVMGSGSGWGTSGIGCSLECIPSLFRADGWVRDVVSSHRERCSWLIVDWSWNWYWFKSVNCRS